MINITLPDGSQRQYENPLSGIEISKSISKTLAKEALAIKADDNLKDLNYVIDKDCKIEIVTKKSSEGLDILRHDAAHIMAEAVQNLFPDTKVSIGPTIENGFYYDFDRKESFSSHEIEEQAFLKRVLQGKKNSAK